MSRGSSENGDLVPLWGEFLPQKRPSQSGEPAARASG